MENKIPLVADTSALISLVSTTDRNHSPAVDLAAKIGEQKRPLIVPGEIVTEALNVFSKKISKEVALEAAKNLLGSGTYLIVETTPQIRGKALGKFKVLPRMVSFTDCLVMAFADEFETREIFGFDEVFAKEGYKRFGLD